MSRRPAIWVGVLLILIAVGLLIVFRPTAKPTPAPTPAPTLASTPSAASTPAPSPTRLDTPGTTLAPLPPPVTVDLTGKISDTGILLEDVAIVSSDGRAKMTLPKGGRVLDTQGQPPKYVTCTPMTPQESKEGLVVGLSYDFTLYLFSPHCRGEERGF